MFLERLKQLREEADWKKFDIKALNQSKLPWVVLKVPPTRVLRPIDAEYPTKQKTRSEIATEDKKVEVAKKKSKRSKKKWRGLYHVCGM